MPNLGFQLLKIVLVESPDSGAKAFLINCAKLEDQQHRWSRKAILRGRINTKGVRKTQGT
jgi:hypothetical protein